MICPFCSAEQPDGKTFCMACGKRITGNEAAMTEQAPAEPEPENPIVEAEETRDTEAGQAAETPGAGAEQAEDAVASEPAPKANVYHSVLDKEPDRDSRWATIGTGGWFGILLLMAIPVVNLICVLVWSFGGTRKRVLQSYARASLLWGLLTTILAVVGSILLPRYAGSIVDSLMQFINLL